MKTIYDLKLHEGIMLPFGVYVMRVPGGWLYNCLNTNLDHFQNGIFIPFDNDCQIKMMMEESKNG